ncbi:MAG: hypothetical protein J0L99_00085 [Chitinophagales bacterium]|nr:hypothetical protein [Chitinophagales bacterium]
MGINRVSTAELSLTLRSGSTVVSAGLLTGWLLSPQDKSKKVLNTEQHKAFRKTEMFDLDVITKWLMKNDGVVFFGGGGKMLAQRGIWMQREHT